MSVLDSAFAGWLDCALDQDTDPPIYRLRFQERHIGNPWIRAVHGGVTAGFLDVVTHTELQRILGLDARFKMMSSSVDYLRVSRDVDILARARVERHGRRQMVIDAWAWQDTEAEPITRSVCSWRIWPESIG